MWAEQEFLCLLLACVSQLNNKRGGYYSFLDLRDATFQNLSVQRMSYRRGAPSNDPKAVERREWYSTFQNDMYFKISDDEDSDDDRRLLADDKQHDTNSRLSTGENSRQTKTTESKRSSTTNDEERAESPVFVSFATNVALESAARVQKVAESVPSTETFMSSSKVIKCYDPVFLDDSLIRLNKPKEIRAVLLCIMGFNDNGLMLENYASYWEEFGIELISFVFPGRLSHVNLDSYTHINEYVDLALATLIHHGYAIHQQFDMASSVISPVTEYDKPTHRDHIDIATVNCKPPLTMMGHNYGALIAFELAREFEKDMTTTLLNFHKLIVSAARPPQALTQFNKDTKSRKYHKDSNKDLLNRMIELGFVPKYLHKRRDMLMSYVSRFRCEYQVMETYKLIKFIGRLSEPLDCDIFAMGGDGDRSVSERLLTKWGELTTGSFDCHMFNKGGHFYWTQSEEDERAFLSHIVNAVLLSPPDVGKDDESKDADREDAAIDNQSTVSSVTFTESFVDQGSVDEPSRESKSGHRVKA